MRRGLTTVALLPLVALAACGSDDDSSTVADDGTTTIPVAEEARYEFAGTVLENADHGPELCPGAMVMSYPPQCGGVPTEGWSWEGVPGVQEAEGTTWAEVRVVGTYDGEVFTPVGEVTAATPGEVGGAEEPSVDEFSPACDDHEVADPARVTEADFQAANAATDGRDTVAATWVSYGERATEEWVLNVVVTEDAAGAESELRALWGGGLCVVEREQPSDDELYALQEQVPEALGEDVTVLSSSADVVRGQVVATVVVATDEMQAEMDEQFGAGVVRLEGFLQPVD